MSTQAAVSRLQILSVQSPDPEMTYRPSGVTAQAFTSTKCPSRQPSRLRVARSQICSVPSSDAEIASRQSGVTAPPERLLHEPPGSSPPGRSRDPRPSTSPPRRPRPRARPPSPRTHGPGAGARPRSRASACARGPTPSGPSGAARDRAPVRRHRARRQLVVEVVAVLQGRVGALACDIPDLSVPSWDPRPRAARPPRPRTRPPVRDDRSGERPGCHARYPRSAACQQRGAADELLVAPPLVAVLETLPGHPQRDDESRAEPSPRARAEISRQTIVAIPSAPLARSGTTLGAPARPAGQIPGVTGRPLPGHPMIHLC